MSAENKTGSGWYGRTSTTGQYMENKVEIDAWYDRIVDNAYRGVSVEAPAKMICALGRLAQQEGMQFQNLIESILDDYLAAKGIDWRKES